MRTRTSVTIHNFFEKHHSITFRLGWASFIICLSALQFGYHLAELNAPADILSCNFDKPGPLPSYDDTIWSQYNFKQCIPMSEEGVALITTSYTIGGLVASVILGSTSISMDYGRRSVCIFASLFFVLGSSLMVMANSAWMINLGRFFNGAGAASSLIMSPILINELAPVNHRGLLGALMQIAVSIGIFLAQYVSYFYSNDQQWRQIFVVAVMIALIQFLGLFSIPESPKWMIMNGGDEDLARSTLYTLRTNITTIEYEIHHWHHLAKGTQSPDENTPLLEEDATSAVDSDGSSISSRKSLDPPSITITDFLFEHKYRKQLISVILIMTGQQLSGMNAITYYGVKILNTLFNNQGSGGGNYVLVLTCAFSGVNVISSISAAPLIDRLGRKPLLLASIGLCGLCSLVLAIGIPNKYDVAVITACFGFIIGFSIGLGPLPFLMVSELTSHEVVSLAQSFGTVTNWTANMMVAMLFPLLQNLIGGTVFYIFFAISVAYLVAFYYKIPETKGYHHSSDVWEHY
ncbi:HGT20 [[Candida] subhashii]|uniref:HGT20 n=1 Tax=[Candida] subhashii TaxID=561895 RepID=A0A8J5QM73_9ASCO|nr:HGT20 [[Candida] subhashii]KAG7662887.1 HGT20 [[Candida] subhashii]